MLAIAGFGAIAAAAMALLLLYGFSVFGNVISHIIPRFGVGPFHVDIGGIIRGAVNAAFRAVSHVLDSAIGILYHALYYPIHVVAQLYDWASDGITEAANTAEWIIKTYVPRYYNAARHYAYSLVVYAENYAAAHLASVEHYLYGLIVYAENYANARLAEARKYLYGLIVYAEHYAAGLANSVMTFASHNIAQLEAWLFADVKALQTDITRAVAEGEAYTRAYAGSVTSALSSAIAATDAKIVNATSTAISGAVGVITTDIGNVAATTWQDLDTAVTAATGVLATDFPDIGAWIKGLSITKALDIAGVTALSISTAGVLARYLEKCGVPNCRNLSAIGRALSDLFGVVEDGALLGMLAELIADPEGAAQELNSILSPIVDPLVSAGKDLLGVG